MENIETYLSYIAYFAFFYPLLMSFIWMEGALMYFFRYEFRKPGFKDIPEFENYPMVSVLVPCYNEGITVKDTIEAINDSKYPNFEIIAINDGSSDNTLELLNELSNEYTRLRVINLETNQGKAVALKTATLAARGEFLVCIDGDTILDPNAIHWFMFHLAKHPRVGAVTGNPRVRTRSTLIGRIQVGEFSAIIGLLKRAQRIYGRVFTISGVVAAFRKSAIAQIGYWNENVMTEDIDISWRMQINHWDVRFEPRALCWVLMPETLRGLIKQRFRWAVGGVETFKNYTKNILKYKVRRMWPIYLEYLTSIIWAYTVVILTVVWVMRVFGIYFEQIDGQSLFPVHVGMLLATVCLIQFLISMSMDARYDHKLMKYYLANIWYPIIYWMMNCILGIIAFPYGMLFKKSKERGKWESPDRGIHIEEQSK